MEDIVIENQYIIDFCKYCEELAHLTIIETKKAKYVRCSKCGRKTFRNLYDETLFGIHIDICGNKRKLKEETKNRDSDVYIISDCDESRGEHECIICNGRIYYENLQCIHCSQIFCFSCLIKWIYDKSKCPCCSKKLTKSKISTFKEKKIKSESESQNQVKSKKVRCISHKEKCTFYCITCCTFICNKCIVDSQHDHHKKIEKEDLIQHLYTRASKELINLNSAYKERSKLLNYAEFYEELNNKIHRDALEPFCLLLDKIKETFNKRTKCLRLTNNLTFNSDLEISNESIKTLELFCKTKDIGMISQVLQTLNKGKEIKNESKEILDNIKEIAIKNDILTKENLRSFKFNYLLSNKSEDKTIKVNELVKGLNFFIGKHETKNTFVISANLEGKGKSDWYCKLRLEENSLCNLKDNNIQKISLSENYTIIGVLELKSELENINEENKIKFKVTLLEINKAIAYHERKTISYIESKIFQSQHFTENLQAENNLQNESESKEENNIENFKECSKGKEIMINKKHQKLPKFIFF